MNKWHLILVLGALFFSGCTSTMVVSPGSTPRSMYAPVNETSRRGVIKYLNQGAPFVIAQRREDAYRQMYNACGGKYRIISEGPKDGTGMAVPFGNMMMYDSQQYIYIEFEAVDPAQETKTTPATNLQPMVPPDPLHAK